MDYFPILQKTSVARLPQLAMPTLLSTTIFKSFVFTHVTAILKSCILNHATVLLSSSGGCTNPSPSHYAFTALFPHQNTLLPPSSSRSHRQEAEEKESNCISVTQVFTSVCLSVYMFLCGRCC